MARLLQLDSKSLPKGTPAIQLAAGFLVLLLCGEAAAQDIGFLRQFGTAGADEVTAIETSLAGPFAIGTTDGVLQNQRPAGATDIFVMKFDPFGNLQGATQLGTSGIESVTGSLLTPTALYICGRTSGVFPGQTSAGGLDAYLMKLDLNGNLEWVRQFGTSGTDSAEGVSVDPAGAVYVGGTTNGALPGQTLASAGVDDVFLRKYDESGAEVWTRQFGSASTDQAFDVSAGISNVFIAGRTNGALIGQTNAGAFDGFIRRFDFNGTLNATHQFGTAGNDDVQTIDVGTDGLYAGGSTAGVFPGQIRAGGLTDAYISRLDFDLSPQWVRQFGTAGDDRVLDVYAKLTNPTGSQFGGSTTGTMSGFVNRGGVDAMRGRYDGAGTQTNIELFGTPGTDSATAISNPYVGGVVGGSLLNQPSFGSSDSFVRKLITTLVVEPTSLRLSTQLGSSPERRALRVSGGGLTDWRAELTLNTGAGWLVASPLQGNSVTVAGDLINLDFNPSAISTPGVYQATVTVTSSTFAVKVPITLVAFGPQPSLVLSRSEFVFRARPGGAAPPDQPLGVGNLGAGNLNWSVDPATFPTWLRLTPASSTLAAGASIRSSVSVNPADLAPGVYQAPLQVFDPSALNSPQQITVTLAVVPPDTPPSAELSVNGVVFVAAQGSAAQSRNVLIGNAGVGGLTYQLQTSTTSGGNWLTVTPASGTVNAGSAIVQASVNPATLGPGIYRGRIFGSFTGGAAPDVDVVLVVTPAANAISMKDPPRAAACGATRMDLVATTLGNGMALPVSFPRSILVQVVDSCGDNVNNATAFANIAGKTFTLDNAGQGTYRTTWTPDRELAQLQVLVTATHPVFGSIERTYTVSTTVAGPVLLPVIAPDGVVEGAGFTRLRPLAPGSIISIFGSQFATGNNAASELPLARSLGGTSVIIGGEQAPLYFVGPGQINAQVPFSLRPGDEISVAVNAQGRITSPQNYLVAPNQPGVFQSQGVAAVLDTQFRAINDQNPAVPGAVVQIFANGLGLVDQTVASGAPSPGFSTTRLPVSVLVGGLPATVLYQGLAPGFVGLYQVNVQLPANVPTGNAVPLVIQQDGIVSNPELPVSIPIL